MVNRAVKISNNIERKPAVNITKDDINQLVREPSSVIRAHIATKVCDGFNHGNFSESEHNLALEIFRLLLRDTEARVRKTLAEELKHNINVPKDIALAIANDKSDVAIPFLQFSYVLSEDELVDIIRATNAAPKLKAIASRETLSAHVCSELLDCGYEDVTRTLIRNNGAQLSHESYEYLLEEYCNHNSMLEELVYRGNLPAQFAEQLFELVSDQLRKHLTKRYRLGRKLARDVTSSARESAMLQFLSHQMSDAELDKLVDNMHKNKRLTSSVIIRALCEGDLRFFEAAMARMADIPVQNARILMLDPGELGFSAFYDSSAMPEAFRDAMRVVFHIAIRETNYGQKRPDDFAERVIQKIVSGGYAQNVEHMPYLMSIIGRSRHEHATIH